MYSGIRVQEKNSTALVDAMELLLSGPDLRSSLSENARAKVLSQFTLEDNVRIVQRLINGAAEGAVGAKLVESPDMAGITVR
jgi:glycosyltransferase involved in cell wall biosynthesis